MLFIDKYYISYIFLILGVILVLYTLVRLGIDYFKYKDSGNQKLSGYDIAKEVLDNNNIDDVNIIESKDEGNLYNVRRKVIKLSTKTYYGKSNYDMALALHEASHAIVDSQNNNYINIFRKIFTNLKFYAFSSYIVLLVSYLLVGNEYNSISLGIFIGLIIYQYIVKNIENDSYNISINELDKIKNIDKNSISNILTHSNWNYDISLFITILQIARVLVFMLLK